MTAYNNIVGLYIAYIDVLKYLIQTVLNYLNHKRVGYKNMFIKNSKNADIIYSSNTITG